MNKKEAFGLFIAKHRQERGMSQAALARAVGISRPYLTQIENGKRMPGDDKFVALLVALGVTMQDFMTELLAGEVPEEQLDSMLTLTQSFDVMQQLLTPDQVAAIMQATPSLDQMAASVANLGGLAAPSGPDGWLDLSAEDRRLVQRLVNRLLTRPTIAKETDDGDPQA
jgi:transcriptional regulator with XRE-family HTH domain